VNLYEGNAQAALQPARHAFEIWQQMGAPYLAARLRILTARACAALGDMEGAQLELTCAREVFERLGAQPDVAALNALVTQFTVASTFRPKAPNHGLSPRELQVLRLIATGKTNKMIARELALSEKTVDRHVSNIFAKINVASRAAATAFAYQQKLV
jgi:DNA-binding CsgD family transcriptional regulator